MKTAVRTSPQELTEEEKSQALSNIGGLSKNQGTSNSGKFLGIGTDGIVKPITVKGDPGASAWSEITDKPFNTIDGNTLVNRSGTLCVNTTDDAEQDNTRPITSSGVHVICGNINALLQAI